MGLLTNLVELKSRQDEMKLKGAYQGIEKILSTPGVSKQTQEWALDSLAQLTNQEFGGGGSSKGASSGGGGKGGGGKTGGIGDIFKGIIGTMTGGLSTQLSQENQRGKDISGAMGKIESSRPKQLLESDEEKQAREDKETQVRIQREMRANAIIAQQKASQDEEMYNTEYKRATDAGLTPQQAYERASSLAGNKTPPDILRDTAKKPSAGKNATIIGPDGKEFIGVSRQMEDGSTQLFKIGSTTPLDPATYSEKVKEPQDVSSLRGYEEDLKTLKDPNADPTKKEAAKLDLRDRANKNQATVVRIEREQQQNKTDNAPANPDATNFWSGVLAAGGHIDYGQWRTMGKRQQADIMAKVPQLAAAAGMNPGQFLAQQSDVKALQGSLSNMEKQYAVVSSFEKTAQQNLDRAINTAKQITDTGSPFINKPWREAEKTLFGQPQYAAFHAARITAFTEVSKVLNGALGNGAVSDSARKEAEGALSESATLGQLQAAADLLKQDMESRTSNMKTTIDSLKGQIGGGYKPPLVPGGGKKTPQQEADEFLKSLPQ